MNPNGGVLGFVMAGGQGTRLKVLTKDTCKPALDILGHYRIFDFVATNVANTGIPVTLVATQSTQRPLSEYIGNGELWGFNENDKKLEVVCPSGDSATFDGTADSVRKSVDRVDGYNPNIVLVLGADHVYAMNYRDIIRQHELNKADITIMTNAVPESKVRDFGIVRIDESGRIVDFAEKPTDKEVIESFRLSPSMKSHLGIDDPNLDFLASMGNYVFFWDRLKRFLNFPGMDFGKDIIPAIKENHGALYAYVFNGYWRDVGRIRDYFNCSMDFANGASPIDLLKYRIGVYEKPCKRIFPGPSIRHTILSSCDVVRQGSTITDSILGHQVVIGESCRLDHCILLGAERNGSRNDRARREEYTPQTGKCSRLAYVILDKNVRIGEGVDIGPHNGTPEERKKILQGIGLKPYRELADGTTEGDFYIEPEAGILVIGGQDDLDPRRPILPDGLES